MNDGSTGERFLPTARRATDDDLDELVRLDELARAHLGPLRGGALYLVHTARPTPARVGLAADLHSARHLVVVGSIGAVVVGYSVARLSTMGDGTHVAEISELFVETEARDVGVGAALMGELLAWANEHDCIGIDAHALPGDRATKNFFESFGLVARAITVHRALP